MSLVEIIIVIALMSVIAGVTGYGLSLIGNKPVEECTKKVEMVLNRNRISSMGKMKAELEFYLNGDGLITVKECLQSSTETAPHETEMVIGVKDVNMRITYLNGSQKILTTYSDGNNPRVAFSRDSGAVKEIEGLTCTKIEIYKGNDPDTGSKKTIELETLTGKVTIR